MNEENNYNPFNNMDNNSNFDNNTNSVNNGQSMNFQPQMFAQNTNETPVESPVEPTVIQPTPVESTVEPAVIQPTPVESPVEPTVVQPTPVESPVEPTVIQSTPVESPVEPAVIQPTPVENVNAEQPVADNNFGAPVDMVAPQANDQFAMGDNKVPSDNKKLIKIASIVVGVLALLAIGFFVVTKFFLVSGKNVVSTSITKVYDYVLSSVDKMEKSTLAIDFSKDSVGVKGNVGFSSSYKDDQIDLSKLENYSLSYDSVFDLANEKFSIEALLGKDGETVVDGAAYLKDKVLSLSSSQLSSYSYTYDIPRGLDFEFNQSFGYADVKLIVNKAKKITLDNIDEKLITKENAEKNIGGKSKSYTKVTYKMDNKKLAKDILTGFKNDSEVVDAMARISGQTKDEIIDYLEEQIKDIDDVKQTLLEEKNNVTIYEIYVDNFGSFVALDVKDQDNKMLLEVTKSDGNYSYNIYDGDRVEFKGNYLADTKTFNFYYTGNDSVFELTIKELSDTKVNIGLNLAFGGLNLGLDVTLDNVVSGNKQTINMDAKVKYSMNDEGFDFSVKSNTEITKGATVKEDSNTLTKSIDEITYDEQNEISFKIREIVFSILKDFVVSSDFELYESESDLYM